jgi:hypothetical protein
MTRFIEIRGTNDLARLSTALRAAGEQGKGLKRELSSSLNRETKQTRKDMRAAILPGLPQSGGLAADVQRSTRFSTKVSTGRNVGVTIKARGRRSIRRMNTSGSVRHRVFGRGPWVTQTAGIEKGFLDKPFEESRPALQRAIVQAIARIRAKIL